MKTHVLLLAVVTALAPLPLHAWGEKGHYLVNEAATYGTPAAMPHFFHKAYPNLVYMGYEPDRWRNSGDALHAVNPPNHYLDYEYVDHLELPRDRYRYLDLLYTSGTLAKWNIRNTSAGFLPWRIAELADRLTVQWRLWRASEPGLAREQIEANIVSIAGELGHYVADAANPHHTTIHYNGWALAPNPNGYRFDCGTHSRFETQFVSRTMTIDQIRPLVREPVRRTDYFQAALDHILEANALVETLYTFDRDGDLDWHGSEESREFTAARLASGASMLRDLWWSTWLESAERPRRSVRD